jgi:inner membrane protein
LDILLMTGVKDDLMEIVVHRSYSHALLPHFIFAFLFAWITYRLFKRKVDYRSWYWLWFLGFSTHALLDACTTYGTRLFLPFTDYQVGFNNISVIDPLYTLPFMGILIFCLFLKRDNPDRLKWAWRSIYISTSYMALTMGVKFYIHLTFKHELNRQSVTYDVLNTSPTILNNMLWAGMAYDDSTLTIGEYSLFQKTNEIQFLRYKRNLHLEKEFNGKELETLKWFSQGMYILEKKDSATLNVFVVKFGRSDFEKTKPEEAFIFYYELKREGDKFKVTTNRPDFKDWSILEAFQKLWERIWHYPS